MDKLRLSVFDVFGAMLPGIPLLISFVHLYEGTTPSIAVVVGRIDELSLAMSFASIVASYVLGFLAQYPAYEMFKPIIKKFWPKRLHNHEVSIGKRGKEIVKARNSSDHNVDTLQSFLALRTMCYTFFFSFTLLLLMTLLLFLSHGGNLKDTLFITIGSIVLGLGFLRRAVSFHEWAQMHITDTVSS